jgi:hypothetical protein
MPLKPIIEMKYYSKGSLCTYGILDTNKIIFYFLFKSKTGVLPLFVVICARGAIYKYPCQIEVKNTVLRSEIISITEYRPEDGFEIIGVYHAVDFFFFDTDGENELLFQKLNAAAQEILKLQPG